MEQPRQNADVAERWRLPDGGVPVFDPPPDANAPPVDPAFLLIAPHVDAAFYLAQNPDVRAAAVAPAEHYWRMGWREGRDPSPSFGTEYYLRANPDVAAAGLNPLWHYIAQGRAEGRPGQEPGGPWREELDRSLPLSVRPAPRAVPADAPVLDAQALGALLAQACIGARGLVLAFSHDRYTLVPGGTQLLIADEQRKFNGDLCTYLHLAPLYARLGLAPPPQAAPDALAVTLDGVWRGVAAPSALAVALAALAPALARLLVVHALHGLQPEAVAELAAVLGPRRAVFWAHDYGAACTSPRLLRNDIAFCGAPPADSLACRVCVYGQERAAHLARVMALFRAVSFHLAAPSALAARIWLQATALPTAGVHVHPHARLEDRPAEPPADVVRPVRVAFVGHAMFAKGWGVFADLLRQTRGNNAYRFFHFASPGELRALDGSTPVPAAAGPDQPFGMLHALAEERIDIVLALSPWPETFGYVAHEALAAGAALVVLESAGHVVELVSRSGRGVVLADAEALAAYFVTGRAVADARGRRRAGRRTAWLRHRGSTATLGADAQPQTDDPGLFVLADAERLAATADGDALAFALPASDDPARTVRLRSRHLLPRWEADMTPDPRRLGVAVAGLTLDGEAVAAGDPRRRSGWHAPEPGWQWTDGDAVVQAGTARRIVVRVLRLVRYWRAPALDGSVP
jgi:hypothetical protein